MLRDTIPMVWQHLAVIRATSMISFFFWEKGRAPGETHQLCFDTTLYYRSFPAVLIHRFYQAKHQHISTMHTKPPPRGTRKSEKSKGST